MSVTIFYEQKFNFVIFFYSLNLCFVVTKLCLVIYFQDHSFQPQDDSPRIWDVAKHSATKMIHRYFLLKITIQMNKHFFM